MRTQEVHAAAPKTKPKAPAIVASVEKAPLPTGDRLALLKASCKDEKCICINNAIFKHDSSWATAGVGRKANNPGNMRIPRTWSPSVPLTTYHANGNGTFAKFATLQDGVQANVELYYRFYDKFETADALVDQWADGGGNWSYRNAVRSCFRAYT